MPYNGTYTRSYLENTSRNSQWISFFMLSYSGRRSHFSDYDAIVISLCFGSIALLIFSQQDFIFYAVLKDAASLGIAAKNLSISLIAIVSALISAVIWRSFLQNWIQRCLAQVNLHREDGYSNAWTSIVQTDGYEYSELYVRTKDGYEYDSFPLGDFNKLPNGPCVLGADGSIALYITSHSKTDQEPVPARSIQSEMGSRMHFIPADNVAEIAVRRVRVTSAHRRQASPGQ